jgi:hypothetical protein
VSIYLYLNGQQVAEVIDLTNNGNRQWSFSCRPPILDSQQDYEIYWPVVNRHMRIMILNLSLVGTQSQINAVEP